MIFKEDMSIIGYYLGKILDRVGIIMIFPITVGIIYREWSIIPDFIIGLLISLLVSYILRIIFHTTTPELKFKHAMSIAAFTWIFGAGLAAIPMWLSGFLNSYMDSYFEGMSGFTSTGFSMIPDLDHLPRSINFWRHSLQFFGGVGIVMLMLAILTRGITGMTRLYFSEGREDRISPNISKTARSIFSIALLYLTLGIILLWLIGIIIGMSPQDSLFDAIAVSMAALGRGGFGLHSQSILYYHSMLYEIGTIFIFFMGTINFIVHYFVLTGNRKELFKNIEVLTFLTTVFVLSFLTISWLSQDHVYSNYIVLFRKGFYILMSGHATTGFQTVYPAQISKEWTNVPEFAVIIAMLLGASTCSTGGGIKSLRVGVILKSFHHEIKKIILPETAIIVEKYHHIQDIILTDKQMKNAFLVVFGYIILFLIGSIITMSYNYNVVDSMFETASAIANTGLSAGIMNYTAPPMLKITYMFLMWVGRLEIMPVFVLLGVIYLAIKRRPSLLRSLSTFS